MRILHTVAGLWEGTGGPVASITSLCAGLAARGHDVTLLTGSGRLHPAVAELQPRVRVRTESLGPYAAGNWSRPFREACSAEARLADVVHDHGVWLHTNWSSVRMAVRAQRPVIRSPRGMLSPWARRRSRLLKRLLWTLIERRLFDETTLVHLTSELEERDVRDLGVTSPTVVIPNGIDLERELDATRIAAARAVGLPEAGGRRVVLFLSRIHPKKGLDLLCRVWADLPAQTPALLLVAGMGDDASVGKLRRWIAEQPGPPARYLGAVAGQRKLELLSSAWILALSSYSENYGMVVGEALACGTPVVTTVEMPWEETKAAGCGWVVAPRTDTLAQALREALALPCAEHESMRVKARSLVARFHSLEGAVARMEERYRSIRLPPGPNRG